MYGDKTTANHQGLKSKLATKDSKHKKGSLGPIVFSLLILDEDETALCQAVAFPDVFARRKRPFCIGDILPVRGKSVRQDRLAVLEVN